MSKSRAFIPVNLDVIRLRASQDESSENHVSWTIGYEAEKLDKSNRVVIATLHAGGANGWGDITVGAFFLDTAEAKYTEKNLADWIRKSEAAESLYDYARSHLLPLLMAVGAEVVVDRKAPKPKMRILEASPEAGGEPSSE